MGVFVIVGVVISGLPAVHTPTFFVLVAASVSCCGNMREPHTSVRLPCGWSCASHLKYKFISLAESDCKGWNTSEAGKK
jgi:hypothetical protein